uniref:cysteine-rich repeat secretory protein 38-like n=1 Tax=Erigeron canadensis TaxID=72917 RepID=UPI001CB8C239|nr:cysteine-rich repeat secretory protein 38-like [Erigeron canadensis]
MKSPFIIIASILIQIIHFTTAQSILFNNKYPIIRCQSTFNNITLTTAYKTNIITALTSVTSAVTSNYGFKKTTVDGESPNRVTAAAICRGDIDSESCKKCITNSSITLTQNCPNRIEALVWNMNCSLLYSNRTHTSTFYNRPYGKILSYVNASSDLIVYYKEALRGLAARLRIEAAGGNSLRKFATGDVVFGQPAALERIYAMVQCTPDLSSFDCNSCLSVVFREAQGCCDADVDVSVYYTSCFIRYSNKSFYNDPPLISLPSSGAFIS